MGMKIGEIDSIQIIDNEFRIKVLDKYLEWILKNNPNIKAPSDDDLLSIQHEIIASLQKKYPNSGLKLEK